MSMTYFMGVAIMVVFYALSISYDVTKGENVTKDFGKKEWITVLIFMLLSWVGIALNCISVLYALFLDMQKERSKKDSNER